MRPDPVPGPGRRAGPCRAATLPVTCEQFRDDVLTLARGFIAAGVGHGDRVALMSRTRYEWTLVDYALWAIGAVTVPVYETSSAEQLEWILADSGAVGCVVETAGHAEMLAGLRDGLPALRQMWQIDGGELIAPGRAGPRCRRRAGRGAPRAVSGGDVATIVYTSGTTGRPKGCVLTHRNIYCDVTNATAVLPQLLHPGASTVLFLPLAHAFARLIQVGMVQTRATMVHSADMGGVLEQLRRYRPTFILAVPRVLEKMYARARQKADDAHRGWLFAIADAGGGALQPCHGHRRRARTSCCGWRARVLDLLAYRKLRAALGGRCRHGDRRRRAAG